ncbi:unnamed protein product [Laminaria digitata]
MFHLLSPIVFGLTSLSIYIYVPTLRSAGNFRKIRACQLCRRLVSSDSILFKGCFFILSRRTGGRVPQTRRNNTETYNVSCREAIRQLADRARKTPYRLVQVKRRKFIPR